MKKERVASVFAVLFLVFSLTVNSGYAEDKSTVNQMLNTLLDSQNRQLALVNEEIAALQEWIPVKSAELVSKTQQSSKEFQKIMSLSEVSAALPGELTILAEQARRLQESLSTDIDPFQDALQQVSERLSQLEILEANTQNSADPAMQELYSSVLKSKKHLVQTKKNLEKTLDSALALVKNMTAEQVRISELMPDLWLDYYLAGTRNMLSIDSWNREIGRLASIKNTLSLNLSTDIPHTLAHWIAVLIKLLTASAGLGLLFYFSRKPASRLPKPLQNTWNLILHNSAPWITLGAALHYSAWTDGNMYQMLASLGTASLCWGQMTLAWDFCIIDTPAKRRSSPLWPMFMPLLIGIVLLFFDPFPLSMSLVWFLMLGAVLWKAQHRRGDANKLVRILLTGFSAMAVIGLLLTPFGMARLSILICMAYTALAVGIQQSYGFIRLADVIEGFLPKEGIPAVLCGLLLAFCIPAVLVLAILSPAIWILAYPGGAYLVRNIADLGFSIGSLSFNPMQILGILVLFYLTRSLVKVGNNFLETLRHKKTKLNPTFIPSIQLMVSVVLWGLFGLYVLSAFGFSLTSVTVIAGGLSVGIGLGMQGVVQNLISGLSLTFGQTIHEGDFVEVGGVSGTIQKISMRNTKIQTLDNATVFVPNGDFLSKTFTNWTHNGRMVRREISVGIAYGSDIELSMRLMKEVTDATRGVLRYPASAVFLTDFGASSLDLIVRYWVSDINDGWQTMNDIRLGIEKAFRENNIEISFPQLDVHIRDQAAPVQDA